MNPIIPRCEDETLAALRRQIEEAYDRGDEATLAACSRQMDHLQYRQWRKRLICLRNWQIDPALPDQKRKSPLSMRKRERRFLRGRSGAIRHSSRLFSISSCWASRASAPSTRIS